MRSNDNFNLPLGWRECYVMMLCYSKFHNEEDDYDTANNKNGNNNNNHNNIN